MITGNVGIFDDKRVSVEFLVNIILFSFYRTNYSTKVKNMLLCCTLGDVVHEQFLNPNQMNNRIALRYMKKRLKY